MLKYVVEKVRSDDHFCNFCLYYFAYNNTTYYVVTRVSFHAPGLQLLVQNIKLCLGYWLEVANILGVAIDHK